MFCFPLVNILILIRFGFKAAATAVASVAAAAPTAKNNPNPWTKPVAPTAAALAALATAMVCTQPPLPSSGALGSATPPVTRRPDGTVASPSGLTDSMEQLAKYDSASSLGDQHPDFDESAYEADYNADYANDLPFDDDEVD
jgi:hypothetical protein